MRTEHKRRLETTFLQRISIKERTIYIYLFRSNHVTSVTFLW